jgi:glycosyltransferase involved in cell wall biosynthesis
MGHVTARIGEVSSPNYGIDFSHMTTNLQLQVETATMPSCELRLTRPETAAGLDGLRVLQVGKYYPPHYGGMETHLEALCDELRHYVELKIVVAASNERRTSRRTQDGVELTRAGTLFNLKSAPFCPQMVRSIRDAKADIVHIHLPNPGAILAYLASRHRGRLIFTYHSDIVRQKVLSRIFEPFLQRALNLSDAIIVSSPNYIDGSTVLQMHREKCRVIPFGITVDSFQRPDALEVARLRRLYGPRMVLGVGRLVYYKGFNHLVRAAKYFDGHVVIVGRGPLYHALKQEAANCGVSDRVSVLTDVQDVRPYYHAADVFALSSVVRSEAFGIVQLEAMACGKPIVNTALDTGVTYVSPDGLTGMTVPPANTEALGHAINMLLDNPVLRQKYGHEGRRRVESEFSVELMTQRTIELYQEVIDGSRRRA